MLWHWTVRQSDIDRSGRVGKYLSSRRPTDSYGGNRFNPKLNKLEEPVNPLRGRHCVPQFCALIAGVSLYSYHVRELLACWLFFCSLFALLGLIVSAVVLAGYAGRYAIGWARGMTQAPPIVALAVGEFRLKEAAEDELLKCAGQQQSG